MANVAIAFTYSIKDFPFQIPGGAVQQYTAIPRARLTFLIEGGVITAKIATNTTSIACNLTLPANYAYTLEYANVHASFATSTSDADNYDDVGSLTFINVLDTNFARVNMVAPGIFGVSANAGSAKIWETDNAYGGPLYNIDGDAPTISIELNDRDAGATVLGSLGSVITVLQYDIQQVFAYPVNFPLPVTSRGT